MIKRRELQREFTRTYVDAKPWQVGAAEEFVRNLRTLVVDMPHLTDGTQDFVTTWTLPGTGTAPRSTAARATVGAATSLLRGLHLALATHNKPSDTPLSVGKEPSCVWSTWHQGNNVIMTLAGSISATLGFCDVTENERERIIMAARRLSHDGNVVFATAHRISDDTKPRANSMTFDGLVACKLRLHPGTSQAAKRLRDRGIRLVYVTEAPEDIALCIAHAAGINQRTAAARHIKFAASPHHEIYAHADRAGSRHIIQALPQPAIIAQHDLVLLADMIDAIY